MFFFLTLLLLYNQLPRSDVIITNPHTVGNTPPNALRVGLTPSQICSADTKIPGRLDLAGSMRWFYNVMKEQELLLEQPIDVDIHAVEHVSPVGLDVLRKVRAVVVTIFANHLAAVVARCSHAQNAPLCPAGGQPADDSKREPTLPSSPPCADLLRGARRQANWRAPRQPA